MDGLSKPDDHPGLSQHAESLREAREEESRALFETAPVGIGVVDVAGHILAFNDAMLECVGFDRPALGRIQTVAELYADPLERTQLLREFEQVGVLKDRPLLLRRQDGTVCEVLLSMARTDSPQGVPSTRRFRVEAKPMKGGQASLEVADEGCGAAEQPQAFLGQPYDFDTLTDTLNRVLAGRGTGEGR